MSTISNSDRQALTRLASSLPKGSPEKKAILAGLASVSKTASGILDLDAMSLNPVAMKHAISVAEPGTQIIFNGKPMGIACCGGYAEKDGNHIRVRTFLSGIEQTFFISRGSLAVLKTLL